MEIIPFIQRVVGIVTFVGFLIVSTFTVVLLNRDPAGAMYLINFEESVDGLSVGASVTYQGIEVGYVQGIESVIEGEFAGTNAVVIVIKSDFLEDAGGRVRIYREPEGEDYHPFVSWVDRGVPARDRVLTKHDWVVAVADSDGSNRVDVETVQQLDMAIREKLGLQGGELREEPLYRLVVRGREGGSEKSLPIERRELGVTFSEGGTRASMAQNLVTGIKHIELVGGHPGLSVLEGLATGGSTEVENLEDARITTMETGFNRLFRLFEQKLPSILQNIDDFLEQMT